MSINVLLVSPRIPPVGGIATWTEEVLNYFSKNSTSFRIINLNTAITLRKFSATFWLVRLLSGFVESVYQMFRFLQLIHKEKPKLIHICTAGELGMLRDIIFVVLAIMLKIPTVIHFHRGKTPDYPALILQHSIESTLTKVLLKLATSAIVLNKPAYDALAPYSQAKLYQLFNFVASPEKITELENIASASGATKLVYVGHVIERKGIFDLVNVVSRLNAAGESIELIIIGPCSEVVRDKLEVLMASVCSDRQSLITFVGSLPRHEIASYLVSSTALCLPSYAEGLPFCIIEAMAHSKPIIASNVGGIPQMVSNESGLCIEPGDILQLEAAILRLHLSPGLAATMGLKSREKFDELFSDRSVIAKLSDLWIKSIQ